MKRTHRIRTLTCASPNLSLNRMLLGGPAARPSSRRLAWFVRPLAGAKLTKSFAFATIVLCTSRSLASSQRLRLSPQALASVNWDACENATAAGDGASAKASHACGCRLAIQS